MKIVLSKPLQFKGGWMVGLRVDGKGFGAAIGATAEEAGKRAIFLQAALEVMHEENEHDTLVELGLKS